MTSTQVQPAHRVAVGAIDTHYLDAGTGDPVVLLHGSGPGVSAWANWRLNMQALADQGYRVLAPDLVGFGYTERPAGIVYSMDTWVRQALDLLDALGVEQADVIGNSFGGALSLALAIRAPQRVRRLVLMGSVGVPFRITEGLDAVWGYEPSVETMRSLMTGTFAYDSSLVTEDMVEARYRASIRPGAQEAFSAMFPAPRQRWVDAMAHDEADVRGIRRPTLLVHGRDDKVIPLSTTLTLLDWIDDSQAHVFGRCGHWTQIERTAEFSAVVAEFLAPAD